MYTNSYLFFCWSSEMHGWRVPINYRTLVEILHPISDVAQKRKQCHLWAHFVQGRYISMFSNCVQVQAHLACSFVLRAVRCVASSLPSTDKLHKCLGAGCLLFVFNFMDTTARANSGSWVLSSHVPLHTAVAAVPSRPLHLAVAVFICSAYIK